MERLINLLSTSDNQMLLESAIEVLRRHYNDKSAECQREVNKSNANADKVSALHKRTNRAMRILHLVEDIRDSIEC